jgi:hypothetical protein
MPYDPQLNMERNKVEAWGLWFSQWQQQTKERLRRHTMSTQTRLKEFEQKHLVGSLGEGLLGNTATCATISSVLSPK